METLKCNACERDLPLESFNKCTSITRGYQYKCKECTAIYNSSEKVKAKKREEIKQWRKDNPEKKKEQKKRHYEKHHEKCLKRSKEWYHTNKDRYRNGAMLRKYGISLEEYNALREQQNYECALCKKHEDENYQGLVIDHSHVTGKVRKLLCTSCNVGLGMFQDNPELLEKAAEYLRN